MKTIVTKSAIRGLIKFLEENINDSDSSDDVYYFDTDIINKFLGIESINKYEIIYHTEFCNTRSNPILAIFEGVSKSDVKSKFLACDLLKHTIPYIVIDSIKLIGENK